VNTVVGRYRLETRISETEATELWNGRRIDDAGAGAKFTPKLASASDERAVRGLRGEYRVRRLLQDKLIGERHVVDCLDVFEDEPSGRVCLVMEHLRGGRTLADLVAADPAGSGGETIDPADAADLLRQACLGLQSIHKAGLVHGDLRPENLFLKHVPEGGRRLLVGGFGSASNYRAPGDSAEAISVITSAGTPQYAPPEAWRNDAGPRSDAYGLGFVFYELLVGRDAFTRQFAAQLASADAHERAEAWRRWHTDRTEAAPVRKLCPRCPKELADVVDAMIRKDPMGRLDVEDALGALGGAPVASAADAAPQRPVPPPVVERHDPPSDSDDGGAEKTRFMPGRRPRPLEAAPSGEAVVVVHVRGSSLAGRTQSFEKEKVRIGRGAGNDVAFDRRVDRLVSNPHAEIVVERGKPLIGDLASKNGTWVTGRAVEGRAELSPDDVVSLGRNGPAFRVSVGAPAQSADAPAAAGDWERIRAAEASSGKSSSGHVGHSTMLRAVGTERRRTNRILLGVAFGVIVLCSLALLFFVESQKNVADELAKTKREAQSRVDDVLAKHQSLLADIARRDQDLQRLKEQADSGDEERRRQIETAEREIKTLHDRLRRAEDEMRSPRVADDFQKVVEQRAAAVFLLVAVLPDGRVGTGTGFAITPDGLLGTNAHVEAMFDKAAWTRAIQNGTGDVFEIVRSKRHPDYGGVASPDVALVRIDPRGRTFPAFDLATKDELRRLAVGSRLGTMGYPGEIDYLQGFQRDSKTAPGAAAVFKDARVTRMTDFEGRLADFEHACLIGHSASTTGGTSGSPLFLADGKVVALNNSGLVEQWRTKAGDTLQITSASQLKMGVRADVLQDLRERTNDLK
jgi:serine/threonine protein kinase/S1-C subfamily serine protease